MAPLGGWPTDAPTDRDDERVVAESIGVDEMLIDDDDLRLVRAALRARVEVVSASPP